MKKNITESLLGNIRSDPPTLKKIDEEFSPTIQVHVSPKTPKIKQNSVISTGNQVSPQPNVDLLNKSIRNLA